jgi:thiosulfate dehydrogenase [quinone] large subunit
MEKTASVVPSPSLFTGRDVSLAYALLRLTMGINIGLHGITRIVAGTGTFEATLSKQFAGTVLPHLAVQAFGYVLPWAEAIIGLLLLFGAWTRVALIAGALVMAMLTFGTCLLQDWNVAGLQLIYSTVYFLLMAMARYNRFSLDGLLRRSKNNSLS